MVRLGVELLEDALMQGAVARRSEAIRRSWSTRKKYHPSDAIDAEIMIAYDQFIRANDRTAIARCAARVGWPGWMVKRRAAALGLARTKERPWSERESHPEEIDQRKVDFDWLIWVLVDGRLD